jgi:hypothetical protein
MIAERLVQRMTSACAFFIVALSSALTVAAPLAPEPVEATSGSSGAIESGSEEVIDDPELAGVAVLQAPEAAPPASFRLELHSRTGVDTRWESAHEDVLESTQIAIFEATYSRSEDLRFAVGIRARHHFARRQHDDAEGSAERYELDAVPIAGYVDATLADGLHTRAGYQIISIGRFDLFSATNFLAVLDLRNGLTTMPEASEVAQPALRTDLDVTSWLTLQAFYVPFFQPHLVTMAGSDYALLAITDQVPANGGANGVSNFVSGAVERSQVPGATTGGIRALGLQPRVDEPQGALRLTARSMSGEVALTAGTALEHLPAIVLSKALEDYLLDPTLLENAARLLTTPKPLTVEHGRFGVLALDGATDIGPVQLGLETAYMVNRQFYATKPGVAPRPGTSDVGHVAARLELVTTSLVTSVEGFAEYAFDEPAESDRSWMLLEDGRLLRGVAAVARFALPGTRIALDVLGIVASGPTYVVTPRIEWEALDRFYLELGTFIFEGPRLGAFGDPDVSIGGIYDGNDLVFAGVRFLP